MANIGNKVKIDQNQGSNEETKSLTRIQSLEDRILKAEALIENLGEDFKKEGLKELDKLYMILNEVKQLKATVKEKTTKDDKSVETELSTTIKNSIVLINNDKVKVNKKTLLS
jgi:hypothetical protein